MIQWGSGLFEYSIDDEVILSGRISSLKHNSLNPKTGKSFTSDNVADNFQECVSKDEIYAVLANNGYDLGDNFKNMTNLNVYKNDVRGNVSWKNDWIYFLDGLLKFPLIENLGTCRTEAPVSVRQISITPATLGNNTATGTIQMFSNGCRVQARRNYLVSNRIYKYIYFFFRSEQ